MKQYIEVLDKSGKNVVTTMGTDDFLKVVRNEFGLGRNAFLADAVKVYNEKNKENNVAKHIIEKNGKRLGESKGPIKAREILERFKQMRNISEVSDEEVDAMVSKEMKGYLEEAFNKYNELLDIMPKINVRDEDIKKEWDKVDKAFDGILKIYKKKYSKTLKPKVQLDYMDIEVLSKKSAGSSSDPKSVYAAVEQISSSRNISARNKSLIYELVAKYKNAKTDAEKAEIDAQYKKILGVN